MKIWGEKKKDKGLFSLCDIFYALLYLYIITCKHCALLHEKRIIFFAGAGLSRPRQIIPIKSGNNIQQMVV